MADTGDSKSPERKLLRVQVPPSVLGWQQLFWYVANRAHSSMVELLAFNQ